MVPPAFAVVIEPPSKVMVPYEVRFTFAVPPPPPSVVIDPEDKVKFEWFVTFKVPSIMDPEDKVKFALFVRFKVPATWE